jgi:regulator of sigma E protease
VIGVLVFVHELGHYLAARSAGIRVDRFSIGFPPRLWSFTSIPDGWLLRFFFFRRGADGKLTWQPVWERQLSRPGRTGSRTEYCIALVPLGGYVKMAGIIDESMDTTVRHEPDEFMSKSPGVQMWVMSAGVIMNMLLAYLIYTGIAWKMGLPEVSPEPVISQLVEGMPAEAVGLEPGDRILTVNGEPVATWQEMSEKIHAIPESPITITWERDGEMFQKSFTTAYQVVTRDGRVDTLGAIGIYPVVNYRAIGPGEALVAGLRSTTNAFGMIVTGVRMLVTGAASLKELGGPIMIAQMAGQTAREGWLPLLAFIAFFSVNLAFLNFLPIPGLDGGHILITLIQVVIRRPLTIRARLVIQQVGMALLLLLMITVIINDIGRLFTN